MPLEPFYSDATQIPESFREHYVERGGRYVLDVAPRDGWALEDVKGLRSAHAKSTEDNRVLRETAKRFRERVGNDLSPDEIAERLVKYEELVAIDPEKQADEMARKRLEAHERRLTEQFEKKIKTEYEPLHAQLDEEKSFARSLLVDSAARAALIEAGADPTAADLLVERLAKQCRVRVEDDTRRRMVEVLDEYGNPRLGENAMAEAAAEFRTKYPALFKGTDASGSGAGNPAGGGGAGRRITDAEVASMSQSDYEKARSEGRI